MVKENVRNAKKHSIDNWSTSSH